jgi:hypothetical protein
MKEVINQLFPHRERVLDHLEPRIQSSEVHRVSLLSLPPLRATLASGYEEREYPLGTLDSFNDSLVQNLLDFFQDPFVIGRHMMRENSHGRCSRQ